MGGLDEIRDRARAQIHDMFALPVTLSSPDGLVVITVDESNQPIVARLHRDLKKPFGDLDREGFALTIEFLSQVIIDRTQWEPERLWKLDFGRGRVVRIENVLPNDGERYVKCEVVDPRK